MCFLAFTDQNWIWFQKAFTFNTSTNKDIFPCGFQHFQLLATPLPTNNNFGCPPLQHWFPLIRIPGFGSVLHTLCYVIVESLENRANSPADKSNYYDKTTVGFLHKFLSDNRHLMSCESYCRLRVSNVTRCRRKLTLALSLICLETSEAMSLKSLAC